MPNRVEAARLSLDLGSITRGIVSRRRDASSLARASSRTGARGDLKSRRQHEGPAEAGPTKHQRPTSPFELSLQALFQRAELVSQARRQPLAELGEVLLDVRQLRPPGLGVHA